MLTTRTIIKLTSLADDCNASQTCNNDSITVNQNNVHIINNHYSGFKKIQHILTSCLIRHF